MKKLDITDLVMKQ